MFGVWCLAFSVNSRGANSLLDNLWLSDLWGRLPLEASAAAVFEKFFIVVLMDCCMSKGKVNKKVVLFSLVAMLCVVLTYLVSWWFLPVAVVLMILNQKELLGK